MRRLGCIMVLFITIIAILIAVGISISWYINAKTSIKKNRNGIIIMALAVACAFFLMLFWEIFDSFAIYLTFAAVIAGLLVAVHFLLQFITNRKFSKTVETVAETVMPSDELPMPKKRRRSKNAYGYTVQEYLDMTLEKVCLDVEPAAETVLENTPPTLKRNVKATKTHKKHPRRYLYQKQKIMQPNSGALETDDQLDEEWADKSSSPVQENVQIFEPTDTDEGQAMFLAEEASLPEEEGSGILEETNETADASGAPAEDITQESEGLQADIPLVPGETVFLMENEEDGLLEQAGEAAGTSGAAAQDVYRETWLEPDEEIFLTEDEENSLLEQAGETETSGTAEQDASQESGEYKMDNQPEEAYGENVMPSLAFIEASVAEAIDAERSDSQGAAQPCEEPASGLLISEDEVSETARRQEAILAKAEVFKSQGRYLLAYHMYRECLRDAEQSGIKELKFQMLDCLVSAGQNEDGAKLVFDILGGKYELTPTDKQQLKAYMTFFTKEE